jgi:hypothetical protein
MPLLILGLQVSVVNGASGESTLVVNLPRDRPFRDRFNWNSLSREDWREALCC